MQFIRAEMYTFRRMFQYAYREIPKRRLCHCSFVNKAPALRYNRLLSSNRTRHKPIQTRCYTLGYTSLFAEGDEHNVDSNFGDYNVRNILHQDSLDPLTKRINECASVDELFSLLNEEYEELKGEHASQLVLVLWDLQKVYNESYLQNLSNDDVERSPEFMLSNYLNKLNNHKDFSKLLRLLDVHYMELKLSEASCCLLYLKKMGVDSGEGVMERLLERCEEAARADGAPAHSLVHLTRLTAALEPKDSFRYVSTVQHLMPSIIQHLEQCNSAEELRLLTFLIFNIQMFVIDPVLERYKARLKHLMDTGVVNQHHYQILLKAAGLLNLPQWSWSNFTDVRNICEVIAPEIPNMDPGSLVNLHKVFQTHLEPAYILEAMNKRIAHHISSMLHDERISRYLMLPHLLYSHITHAPPEKRPAFEKLTSDYMAKIFPSTVAAFYKILRYMKAPNRELCDQFWGKTIYYLIRDHGDDYLVLRFSHKYLYFSNMGQLYRNFYFERLMLDLLIKKFDEGFVTIFPRKLSRLAAFILAYGYSINSIHINAMEQLVQKLEETQQQFDAMDCLVLSRGMQISSIAMSRKHTSPVIAQLFHRVDNVLTERTQALGGKTDLFLAELNFLIKCHINKKTNPNADVTYELIKKFTTLQDRTEQLNSQTIRDIAYNLSTCRVVIPTLFDDITSYVVENKSRILGETAYKVLSLFYSLGFSPNNQGVFQVSCEVIERDKYVMTSLSLLYACCALAYYQRLSDSLVKYVFSIQFMERLDAEVASCYQEWLYPRRVRRQLMKLNRTVCVELPQQRVPWFHQKYMQEQIATAGARKTPLEQNVLETVRSVWPRALVRSPHYSPYGYKLNLLLTLDDENNPSADKAGRARHKVGIMLLENNNFCKILNEVADSETGQYRTVVNGPTKHQRRHLEILGYKVVEISSSMWYAMHMTEPNMKADFLKQKILDNSIRSNT